MVIDGIFFALSRDPRSFSTSFLGGFISHRIHGAAIYGNMDPINIPPMLAYMPYMDTMGIRLIRIFSW